MTTEYIDIQASGDPPPVSLAPYEAPPPPSLFGTTDPTQIMVRAESIANILMQKVRSHRDDKGKQDLVSNIQGKEYVCVGGWTLMGSLVGVFPVNVWTREIEGGWEARVEARTLSGQTVGAAEAMCTRDEKMWRDRDPYALRSMAQTRATSKAMRMPLGFIAQLAGYEGTPAEEMAREPAGRPQPRGGVERPTHEDGTPVQPPGCEHHGPLHFVKAGTSAKGKAYPSFWGCVKDCKTFVNHGDWVTQSLSREAPRVNVDYGDLPSE